jgi:hypothetical protein
MINRDILSEKLKYLVMMNAQDKFDILDFGIDIIESNGKIESYEVNMQCDYLKVIDPDLNSFVHDIKKALQILENVLSNYTISSDGKIIQGSSSNAIVSEASIWKFQYVTDSKQIFDLSFLVNYVD